MNFDFIAFSLVLGWQQWVLSPCFWFCVVNNRVEFCSAQFGFGAGNDGFGIHILFLWYFLSRLAVIVLFFS